MGDIARNEQFRDIALLLFGVTIYLALLLIGLFKVHGEFPGPKRLFQGCLGYSIAFTFATLLIVVAFVPDSTTPSAYEAYQLRAAPIALVGVVLCFVCYLCWLGYELVRTVQWLRRGRSGPLDPSSPPSA